MFHSLNSNSLSYILHRRDYLTMIFSNKKKKQEWYNKSFKVLRKILNSKAAEVKDNVDYENCKFYMKV